ncbi:SH3 domain-containing protein [Acetobacter cerevisiae]|uniref:Aspartyl-tRNA synthetase n=1 Tax=Acetobacter cerevisiae TaxID=178900 RepID=A0A149QH58_9PROT|nr:SH3 domain-containing protein [Acetobacter cerevisiae]KXU96640.1 aspartyl-tRNA synthetase [Acetobacter cerevisiae]
MMFTLPLTFRFRLLSCLAGCAVALSGAVAADKKPAAHKHHAHHAEADHTAARKKTADKPAAKKAATADGKSAHRSHHEAAKAHHAAGQTAHAPVKHKAATVAAGAAAAGAAAGAAGAAADQPATPPAAATPPEPPKGTVTGLPLPRYAALRSDEVNMRAGPGRRFPILWVYHRRGMPMRIEREFDVWRLVEDETGQKGWIQQATLSGGRDFLVPGEPPGDEAPLEVKLDKNGNKEQPSGHMDTRVVATLPTPADARSVTGAVVMHSTASNDAPAVAVLKPGSVGSVKECAAGSEWCKVSVKNYTGWVPRRAIWGVDAEEAITPS